MAWQARYVKGGAMMDETRSAAGSPWIDSRSQDDAVTNLRVLIVGVGTLLDFSVITLLTNKSDLLVADVTYRGGDEFLQKVIDFQPDVLLICESDEFRAATIIDLLDRYGVMASYRVIVTRLNSNTVDVFARVTISHGDDLLAVIRKADDLCRFE